VHFLRTVHRSNRNKRCQSLGDATCCVGVSIDQYLRIDSELLVPEKPRLISIKQIQGTSTAIIHSGPTAGGGGELARYDYTYTASEQIATWRQKQPGMPQREWAIAYDARQQVSAIVEKAVGAPAFSQQQVWSYTYDASGNRTAAQEGSRSSTATYNNLNQFTGLVGGGTTWFRGTVNEAANVTLSGQNARVYADGTFEALMNLGAGVHDVPLQAIDKAGNTTNQTWRVDNGPAGTVVPTHDIEGNVLTDGTRTYTWDAKNRMASVTQAVQPTGTATWAFTYDGGNRRIRETKAGAEVKQWVWNGTSVQEERLVNGTKLRFWTGGFEILDASNQQTGKRLLVTDHLGSTRVVVDGTSGATTASYDYAPWGKRTKISGTEEWSTGYTGHGWHESGLSLAVYRPYDPDTGRWLSRDPIQESGGINLYGYVGNGPVGLIDPMGLAWDEWRIWDIRFSDSTANFTAGMADHLSFGLTDAFRGMVGANDQVDKCADSYSNGEYAGIGLDLAMTGGSAALKGLARKKGSIVIRKEAASMIRKARDSNKWVGGAVDHINTLQGHMHTRYPAFFPTGGLSPKLHSWQRNLRHLKDSVDHAPSHLRREAWDRLAHMYWNSPANVQRIGIDLMRSGMRGCD
jgi:RHS repeat-associated protein